MNTDKSQEIVSRFFLAFEILKRDKIVSLHRFCIEQDINRRNLYQLNLDKSRDIFQVGWLVPLVNDYGVSADWLLTGNGDFYRKKPQKNRRLQNTEKERNNN